MSKKGEKGKWVMEYKEDELISHLLSTLKNHLYDTYKHSIRVAKLSFKVSKVLQLERSEQIYIYKAGLLHDIGKTMIPIDIVEKPDKLTNDEYDIIKLHSNYGADILEALPPLAYLIPAVLYHHERLDGSGYPYGIKNIPFCAQIIGVCDSFDAMTNERPYKKAKTFDEAIQDLKNSNEKYSQVIVSAIENVIITKGKKPFI